MYIERNITEYLKNTVKSSLVTIVICDRNDCMPIDSENMMIPVEII